MKKIVTFLLAFIALYLTATTQTISKRVQIFHGFKNSELYEVVSANIINGDTTINFWVMNDKYFPAEDPIDVLFDTSIPKARITIKKYLDLGEQLEGDMEYSDKKAKIFVSKKIHSTDTLLYISNDFEKFHAFRPGTLRLILNILNEFQGSNFKGVTRRYY